VRLREHNTCMLRSGSVYTPTVTRRRTPLLHSSYLDRPSVPGTWCGLFTGVLHKAAILCARKQIDMRECCENRSTCFLGSVPMGRRNINRRGRHYTNPTVITAPSTGYSPATIADYSSVASYKASAQGGSMEISSHIYSTDAELKYTETVKKWRKRSYNVPPLVDESTAARVSSIKARERWLELQLH
jgi:hypothetical protein